MISDFFKKHKTGVIRTGVGVLSACIIGAGVFGGYSIAKHNNTKEYTSLDSVHELCSALNVDGSYIDKSNLRLKHNGDEPIYVSISDDFPKELRDELISALDHVFGLVGQINPKYAYKIINSDTKKSLKDKTTIEIQFEPPIQQNNDHYLACVSRNLKTVKDFDRTKDGAYLIKKMIIYFNEERINAPSSENEDYYKFYEEQYLIEAAMVHELLHCFGIGDVYDHQTNLVHFNTIMQTTMATNGVTMISPNDYKVLRALYAPEFNNESEKYAYIAESANAIDEYSRKYYSSHNKIQEESFNDADMPKLLTINDGTYNFNSAMVENSNINSIRVVIKNEQYSLTTFNEYNEQIEHCTGNVYLVDGKAYLQSVELKHFNNSIPHITDLLLMRRGKSLNSYTMSLTDLSDRLYGLETIRPSQTVEFPNSTEIEDAIG